MKPGANWIFRYAKDPDWVLCWPKDAFSGDKIQCVVQSKCPNFQKKNQIHLSSPVFTCILAHI